MTLLEHLAELRKRLIISIAVVCCTSVISFFLYPAILHFLLIPYCQSHSPCKLYITAPLDGLSLRVRVSFYGGVFLSSPVLFFEIWRFVTPGLRDTEKHYAAPFVVSSVVLFGMGAVVAYISYAHALRWLGSIGGSSLQQIYNPNSYINLILLLMVAFGLTFEFPVLLVALEVAGVVTPAKLSSWRRRAIVGITIFAAVITPSSDPFSMLALAIPMYIFYEASIVIGRVFLLRKSRKIVNP
ncbi:MAG: twin-arginine translocase subunit TatC [Actinobacteria bacterium]|nr:twin-arginine translocase subunit TatC [Actinomycetota bacterium]MCL6105705.1 twin-arginine translocase subunit TatC [Actinomycetota bacterium]